MKKLNWLDKFAQDQANKEKQSIKKEASTQKTAKEIIVNKSDVPNAKNGKVVQYKGKKYRVVQANYRDEKGSGVVLAAYEGLENNPMGMAMGVNPNTIQTQSSKGQEYARTKLDIQETYTHEQDAEWSQNAANETSQKINYENSKDRTTVEGFYGSNKVSTEPTYTEAPVVDGEITVDLDSEDLGENLDDLNADLDDLNEEMEVPNEETSVELKDGDLKMANVNDRIIGYTKKLASAITSEVEQSLEYAESVIKRTVPARFTRTTLASLEKALDKEGIEVAFDKSVTRQEIKKTASQAATKSELIEVRNFVNTALVDDLEDMLEEADELMSEEVQKIAKATKSKGLRKFAEIEDKMKSMMERRLKSIGIYARFERKYKFPSKK